MGANGRVTINGWVYYNGKYYYMNSNGNPVVDAWIQYGDTWYHFNASGVCDRSWRAA